MSETPQLPTTAIDSVADPNAIATNDPLGANTETWFEYPVRAYPHHTDYGGVVWHGTYLTWMEEARVECLRSMGINFADLVKLGCDLPVIEMSIRYHRAMRLGEEALVKTRTIGLAGVKINWDYKIQAPQEKDLYLTGRVTLVAIDREKGKIMRQLPPTVKDILMKII